MTINYVVGDATEPIGSGDRAILHICNNSGGWGRGFVLALSKKWDRPEREYHARDKTLGTNHYIWIPQMSRDSDDPEEDTDFYVVNMIAQDGYVSESRPRAVNYAALATCLLGVKDVLGGFSFHMPRIGAGLGGGDWEIIEQIIEDALGDQEVYVYDLPVKPAFEEPPVGRRVYTDEWSFQRNADGWRGGAVSRMSWEELRSRFGPPRQGTRYELSRSIDETVNPPFSRVFREGGTPRGRNESEAEKALDEMGF